MDKKELYIYFGGVVVSFFAILFTNYWTYKKITVEDLFLALFGSIFSWGTAIICPLIIGLNNVKFLDKTIIKK